METAYIIECRIVVDGNLKSSTTMPMAYKNKKSVIRIIEQYINNDEVDGFEVTDDNEPFTVAKKLYDMEIKYIYSFKMVYIYD